MRILFIGSVKFSEKALKELIGMNENICGVITKNNSSFNSDFVDISYLAKNRNIPYVYTNDINNELSIKFIKKLNPDIIYCFGWSQLLKKEILTLSKKGVVGFHPSNLPYNRGRHPIIWALFLGLEETASTFFLMDEGADSGDIISQQKVKIGYEDDANSLYEKITNIALQQIKDFTIKFKNNSIQRIKQDLNIGNYWRKRGMKDGIIDFRMSSRAVYNLVRALTKPYVGADIEYNSRYYKVWKCKEEVVHLKNIEPGKILKKEGDCLLVKCYENAIWLLNHELSDVKEGEYL